MVYLGFNGGGFFPRTTGVAVLVVGLVVAVRVLVVARPFAGLSAAGALVATLLALFAAWSYLSGSWSDAPARALVEFDRALLYLLVFLLFASLPRTAESARWLARGVLLAAVLICGAGLFTRVLPDVWSVALTIEPDRLSYPLSYWNAVGCLAAAGAVLAFGMTSDLRERPVVRVLAAGALPVLAATLLLTFSRSSLALAIVCVLVLAALNRSPGVLSGLLVLPAAVVAVAAAYGADEISSEQPKGPAAVAQGHDVALVLVLCIAAALFARWLLLRLDARMRARRQRRRSEHEPAGRRRLAVAAAAAAMLVAVAAGAAAGGADALGRQYDRFIQGGQVADGGDVRSRLSQPGNNGRIDQWRAAWRGFETDRFKGLGAGTYPLMWDLHRREEYPLEDAHSLYVETFAELGIVGGILLCAAVLAMLVALAVRARGRERGAWATLCAASLVWVVHAGVDWDWEVPAITLWFFAAGGLALAAPPERLLPWRPRVPVRVVVALAVVLLLVTPARVALFDRTAQEAKVAFGQGDCAAAADRAADAVEVLDLAPEPYEIVGYCELRAGRLEGAVNAMRTAVDRDPRNWRTNYGLSIALAVAGQDPRPAIRRTRELNPLEGMVFEASELFHETSDPRSWRRRALGARLPSD